MKKNIIYWKLLSPMIHESIQDRFGKTLADKAINNGKKEYETLVENAPELGKGNSMASNAYFAYVFVGAWLGMDKKISPEDMAVIMTDVLGKLKPFFSLINLNKMPHFWDKQMKIYAHWYQSNGKKYPETWKVHFDRNAHKDGSYYYFTSCPICSYLNAIGLKEIMPALCQTDSVMFAYQHGVLHRKHTIASGDDVCDYWITGNQNYNPK